MSTAAGFQVGSDILVVRLVIERPKNIFSAYHAHVYFDQDTVEHASALCMQAGKKFGIEVGRVHQRLVGPHTRWSCQLAFSFAQYDGVVPWLAENRKDLTVFIHGITGNDLADHTDHAGWLGEKVALDLSRFE